MGVENLGKRDKILEAVAERDIRNELDDFLHGHSDESEFLELLSPEQQAELDVLEKQDEQDIAAFFSSASVYGLQIPFTVNRLVQYSGGNPNADSFEAIKHYIYENELKNPHLMDFFVTEVRNTLSRENLVIVLLDLLGDSELYSLEYESAGIIGQTLVFLRDEIYFLKDYPNEYDLDDWALNLIEIHRSAPSHLDAIEWALAETGTKTAEAFIKHSKTAVSREELLFTLENSRETGERNIRNDLSDTFDDYYDDIPSSDEVFNGKGLNVTLMYGSNPLTASIDFVPKGRAYYSPEYRTEFLLSGYEDFKTLFERMDKGEVPKIEVFRGRTNRQMAKASLILGFEIDVIDYFNEHSSEYIVIGKAQIIKEKIYALESRQSEGIKIIDRLRQRVKKFERQEAA